MATPFRLLGVAALGTMIYLCAGVLRDPTSAPASRTTSLPAASSTGDFQERIAAVTKEIESLKLPVHLPSPSVEPQGSGRLKWTHRHYEIELPRPATADEFDALIAPLREGSADIVVRESEDEDGRELAVGIDGLLTHTLSFRWRTGPPRLAIVVVGLGADLLLARDFVSLPLALTFAVPPFHPFSPAVAERARLAGREVLVQLGLDGASTSTAARRPGAETDPDQAQHDAVVRIVDAGLDALPQAQGAAYVGRGDDKTNRDHLRWQIERLEERHVFFLDAGSDGKHPLCELGAGSRSACAVWMLVVPPATDESSLRQQFQTLRREARARGEAIAVVQADATLLAALRAESAGFQRDGVDVVAVSNLLARPSLSRR